jgi:Protein of unknown function (DUF4239)
MTLALSIVIVAVAVAIAVTAMLLVRRRAPEGSYFQDGDRASGVFGVLATGFAIFAGFVIFLAFTTYDQSRNGAETEALLVSQQFVTAQFLPPAVGSRLSGELICYARAVVHEEWPRMEAGAAGGTLNPWAAPLFRTLKLADPKTVTEEAAYSKWLDQTSDREEARRDRIYGAANVIPDTLWVVLLLSASVIFAYMLFFADPTEGPVTQGMLIGSVVAVMTVSLLVIKGLDNPYRDAPGQLQPTAMERALVVLEEERRIVGEGESLPCDGEGRAR